MWQKVKPREVGSPPLARGTAVIARKSALLRRITPACAGNRVIPPAQPRGLWDHPRLRGEQPLAVRARRGGLGSPPLARGTAISGAIPYSRARITPACAGNSILMSKSAHRFWDHPRLRGEQEKSVGNGLTRAGSPPLARGTGDAPAIRQALRRITPACAGNSIAAPCPLRLSRDHPRLRGEQV